MLSTSGGFSILILITSILHCPQIISVHTTADFSPDVWVHISVTAEQSSWTLAKPRHHKKDSQNELKREGRDFPTKEEEQRNLCSRALLTADLSQFPKRQHRALSVESSQNLSLTHRNYPRSAGFLGRAIPKAVWTSLSCFRAKGLWARAVLGRWAVCAVSQHAAVAFS